MLIDIETAFILGTLMATLGAVLAISLATGSE
jgi:hypothetical protein